MLQCKGGVGVPCATHNRCGNDSTSSRLRAVTGAPPPATPVARRARGSFAASSGPGQSVPTPRSQPVPVQGRGRRGAARRSGAARMASRGPPVVGAGKASTTESSSTRASKLARSIGVVVVDFDDTCSEKDSTETLIHACIAGAVRSQEGWGGVVGGLLQRAPDSKKEALLKEREQDMKDLVKVYTETAKSVHESTLKFLKKQEEMVGTCISQALEHTFLGLNKFERQMVRVVADSEVLKGATAEDLMDAGKGVTFKTKCVETLQELLSERVPLYVVSANWSRSLIQSACTAHNIVPTNSEGSFQILANELEYNNDGLSTGDIEYWIQCPQDKDDAFSEIVAKHSELNQSIVNADELPASVALGDSVTDLPALMNADFGIIVGKSAKLREVAKTIGVKVKPLSAAPLHNAGPALVTRTLYAANEWGEIHSFFFDPLAPADPEASQNGKEKAASLSKSAANPAQGSGEGERFIMERLPSSQSRLTSSAIPSTAARTYVRRKAPKPEAGKEPKITVAGKPAADKPKVVVAGKSKSADAKKEQSVAQAPVFIDDLADKGPATSEATSSTAAKPNVIVAGTPAAEKPKVIVAGKLAADTPKVVVAGKPADAKSANAKKEQAVGQAPVFIDDLADEGPNTSEGTSSSAAEPKVIVAGKPAAEKPNVIVAGKPAESADAKKESVGQAPVFIDDLPEEGRTSEATSSSAGEGSTQIQEKVPFIKSTWPRALTIAGSDSGGGAGIQADLKTFMSIGVFGTSVITSITAQNTKGVQGVHVESVEDICAQIDSVLGDIGSDSLKTGMLPTPEVIEAVAEKVQQYSVRNLVVDPVLVSTSGCSLADSSCIPALKRRLFPLATVITPNTVEASALLGDFPIDDLADMEEAAKKLHAFGPKYVLVKGGHLVGKTGTACAVDVLYDGVSVHHILGPIVDTEHTHGTGCTLASAIAAYLAKGYTPQNAIREAKKYITALLDTSKTIALGSGSQKPMSHAALVKLAVDVGALSSASEPHVPNPCDLRCYGVTDPSCNAKAGRSMVEAVTKAVAGGATLIQLREKDIDAADFVAIAREVMAVCRPLGVPVLINDRVDVALAAGTDGVHVGQSDIACADVRRILGPHAIVGVSTGNVEEAVKAQADGADYLGAGAVYPTDTKKDSEFMGLDGLEAVCKAVDIPVVAIGGIKVANAAAPVGRGADGVAVVSGIFAAEDPTVACVELLRVVDSAIAAREARGGADEEAVAPLNVVKAVKAVDGDGEGI